MDLLIKPLSATAEIMEDLEGRGIIRRLCPGKDTLQVKEGESTWKEVYAAADAFGPHKLIAVTINSRIPDKFVSHDDAEDFLIIDRADAAGLVLTIALVKHEELEAKALAQTLSGKDFISLVLEKNNPYASFFTMLPGYCHVETCYREGTKPPSFYVTESRYLNERHADLGEYSLKIDITEELEK